MGTINYGTSKFITVGLNPNFYEDTEGENGEIIEGSRYELMEDMRRYTEHYFGELDLSENEAFKVSIESGYYEGFYINITDEWLYFDDEDDRNKGRKELEKIFEFLNVVVDNGLTVCYPGWCTKYLDYTESKKALETAKTEAMDFCSNKPDYKTYNK